MDPIRLYRYTSTAGSDTIWRQALPPTPASATAVSITFSASTGEVAALNDVLFGDVYVCGGQSNQVFSVGANNNSKAEIAAANNYPSVRILTVGQKTSSNTPLMDLATLEQPWAVVSNTTISDGSEFGHFSAVCWFFAKAIVDALGPDAPPVGLVSSNCASRRPTPSGPRPSTLTRIPDCHARAILIVTGGGTRIESWMTQAAIAPCKDSAPANLYNGAQPRAH